MGCQMSTSLLILRTGTMKIKRSSRFREWAWTKLSRRFNGSGYFHYNYKEWVFHLLLNIDDGMFHPYIIINHSEDFSERFFYPFFPTSSIPFRYWFCWSTSFTSSGSTPPTLKAGYSQVNNHCVLRCQVSSDFIFSVSIKIHHIQQIPETTSPFYVESTPGTCPTLAPMPCSYAPAAV